MATPNSQKTLIEVKYLVIYVNIIVFCKSLNKYLNFLLRNIDNFFQKYFYIEKRDAESRDVM